MATLVAPIENKVILHGVSWETYERLLNEHQESRGTRFTYDEGTLEIMVASARHEEPNRDLAELSRLHHIQARATAKRFRAGLFLLFRPRLRVRGERGRRERRSSSGSDHRSRRDQSLPEPFSHLRRLRRSRSLALPPVPRGLLPLGERPLRGDTVQLRPSSSHRRGGHTLRRGKVADAKHAMGAPRSRVGPAAAQKLNRPRSITSGGRSIGPEQRGARYGGVEDNLVDRGIGLY